MTLLHELTREDEALIEVLNDRSQSMVEETISWALLNSGSWNEAGLLKMVPLISDKLSILPGQISEHRTDGIEVVSPHGDVQSITTGPVLKFACRPDAPTQVVMTGHYDTVFPPDGGFNDVTDLGNGRLNGPGLADMKGGIVMMIEALTAFEQSPNARNVGYQIVLSPDEEIGNPTSAPFLHDAAQSAHVGLTFEPALEDGGCAGARKGSGNFAVTIRGKSAHAGRAHHLGRSAIRAAAQMVVMLEDLNGQHEDVTFNVGKIDGGGPNNQVPDLAVVRFNSRVPDSAARDWAMNAIQKVISEVSQLDGISTSMHGGFYRPPKPFNAAQATLFHCVQETGKAIGLSLTKTDTGGVCEGNNIFAAGVPNIDTLGVRGGRIHSSDEFVETDSFSERASLSALILARLADGRIDAQSIKQLMEAV